MKKNLIKIMHGRNKVKPAISRKLQQDSNFWFTFISDILIEKKHICTFIKTIHSEAVVHWSCTKKLLR